MDSDRDATATRATETDTTSGQFPTSTHDEDAVGGNLARSHETHRERRQRRLRWAVIASGALIITFVVVDAFTEKRIEQASGRFVDWVALHPGLGVLAVIVVYMLATICFVPGSILTIGTGYAFGRAMQSTFLAVALASTAVFVGASLGSISCLLLGRYLFREPVARLAENYPIIRALDRGMFMYILYEI
jgi:uncharacterized membrane protein YdjX (TVP38/TMEM64 family)